MIQGLGIDILSIKRARNFLKNHSNKKIAQFFSKEEEKNFPRGQLSAIKFAKIFTAKEAFFKALDLNIMQWDKMQVKLLPGQRFRIKLMSPKRLMQEAEGSFFQTSAYVGAQIILG